MSCHPRNCRVCAAPAAFSRLRLTAPSFYPALRALCACAGVFAALCVGACLRAPARVHVCPAGALAFAGGNVLACAGVWSSRGLLPGVAPRHGAARLASPAHAPPPALEGGQTSRLTTRHQGRPPATPHAGSSSTCGDGSRSGGGRAAAAVVAAAAAACAALPALSAELEGRRGGTVGRACAVTSCAVAAAAPLLPQPSLPSLPLQQRSSSAASSSAPAAAAAAPAHAAAAA